MRPPELVLLGGPNSGKTHYTGQLYGRLQRRPGVLRLRRDQPLWGMPEALSVPLAAVFVSQDYDERGAGVEVEGAHDVLARLQALLTDPTTARTPTWVVGPPGAGKSSLATMLAASLAEDDRVQPVLVRLRDVAPGRPLLDEVARVLRARHDGEGAALAEVLALAPRLVLLLDGFDEFAGGGRGGVEGFAPRMQLLLRDERVHAVVCFGREAALDARDAAVPTDLRVLTLRAFDDAQARRWCAAWNAATRGSFQLDAVARDETVRALLREPLPLFLAALLHRDGRLPADGELDLATLYRAVVHATCQRHQEERRDLSAAELRRFLRVLGYAVVQRGTEIIHLPEVLRAATAAGVSVDATQVESRALQLVVAVSQRRSATEERAWEFIHRSLGEYLAAEYLAAEVPAMVAVEEDEFGERRPRMDEATLSRRWIERFGPSILTGGVERFFVRMVGDFPVFSRGEHAVDRDHDLEPLRARLGSIYRRLVDEDDAEHVVATARAWSVAPSDVLKNALRNVILVGQLRDAAENARCFAPELAAPGRLLRAWRLGALGEHFRPGDGQCEIYGAINFAGSKDITFVREHSHSVTIEDGAIERCRFYDVTFLPLTLRRCRLRYVGFYGCHANLFSSHDVIVEETRWSGTWHLVDAPQRWRFVRCNLRGLRVLEQPSETDFDGHLWRYLDAEGNYVGPDVYSTPGVS